MAFASYSRARVLVGSRVMWWYSIIPSSTRDRWTRRPRAVKNSSSDPLWCHLAKGDGVLDQTLAKVMTRKPICLREEALAADAIHIFNERNIDDLIVVNAKREPVGLVDSQDLPKLKAI